MAEATAAAEAVTEAADVAKVEEAVDTAEVVADTAEAEVDTEAVVAVMAEVAVTVDTETEAQGTQGAAEVAAVMVVAGGVRFVRNLWSVTLSLLVT